MSSPVVPPPLPPTTAPPLPQSSAIATVPKPPPVLAQLQLSTIFSAQVSGDAPGKGIFDIKSEFGNFRLQSTLNLQAGAKIGFQVHGLAPKLTLLITSLNGKPLQQGAPAWNRTAEALGSQPKTDTVQTTQSGQLANKGAPILATVMRGTPLAGQGGKTPQTMLQQGQGLKQNTGLQGHSPVKGGVSGQQGPLMQPGMVQTPTSSQTPSGQQIQIAFQTLMAGKGSPLPPGMQMQVRITNITQPTETSGADVQGQSKTAPTGAQGVKLTSSPAPSAPPGTQAPVLLNGQVSGSTPQGQTLIQTSLGLLALETKTPLSVGSRVSLEISAQQVLQKMAPLPSAAQAANVKMSGLGEALDVLQEANPALARQVITASIPRPDASLGNTMVFFLTALRVGTFRNLIGESAYRVLTGKGKPGLEGRLGDEFKGSIKKVSDPLTGDWRVAFVPIFNNNQQSEIRISFREHDSNSSHDGDEDKEGTRFIIDVSLERFGRIQFDGLAKEKKKHFDLIIRTEEAMPADVRKDINKIFTNSCEAHGITAQLLFQVTPTFIDLGGVEIDKDTLGLLV